MRSLRLPGAIIVLFVLTSCSTSPGAPSSGQGSTARGTPILVSLRVDGPARLAPGESGTYVATGTYFDGSVRDVSATAAWNPGNPTAALYFTAPGTAIGVRAGEASVVATLGATRASRTVLVLQRGTFRLSGRVVEASDRALEGISVDVVSGIGAGLHARANSHGDYALYGVAGPLQLRVSGEGFTPQIRDLVVTADADAENFVLAPEQPPVSGLAADWTMTLMPSPACPVAPPDVARSRSYQVQIEQQGTGLTYVLSAPTVTVHNPQFKTGVVFGAHVKLYFPGDTGYGDWSTGDVIDRLSRDEVLQFNGTAEGDLKGSTITATMNGDIAYWDYTRTSFAPNWYCRAKDHGVILRK